LIVVYDRENGQVVSSFVANSRISDMADDILQRMHPDQNRNLSYCEVDYNGRIPFGCKVELVDGMAFRLHCNDKVYFEMDPEELRKMVLAERQKERDKMLNSLPFRNDDNLKRLFGEYLPMMRQTSELTRHRIADNSYFKGDILPIGWWGSFVDAGGYANMNREITQRLPNYGIIPKTDIYPTPSQIDKGTESVLRTMSGLRVKTDRYPFVYAFTPMAHQRHYGKRIFYTMMETSSLHPEFVSHCNEYSDEVWVPSVANRELFTSNGVRKKIRVMPLGIDEKLYFDTEVSTDFPLEDCVGLYGMDPRNGIAKRRFLTVIQWNFRKGFDALIKAFCRAFSSMDDVCLVIATQYSKEVVKADLDQYVPSMSGLPQVLLYNKIVPISRMPSLYDSCDCYIHLSRGEGFSLTQIEAAARGLPVISCMHSGMTEYLREDNSYPVSCPEREMCHPNLANISFYYQGQTLWKLGDRQVDQAAEYMRHVVSHPEEAAMKASVMKEDVISKYTWDRSAERIAEALRA